MAGRIRLTVVTPEGAALEEDVEYISIPTPEGSVGVLADHAPMFCAVGKGKLRYRRGDGEGFVLVSGGVASVEDNRVTVLAGEARREE